MVYFYSDIQKIQNVKPRHVEMSVCCSDDYGTSTNGNFLWRSIFFIVVLLWNVTKWHLLLISCPTSTASTSESFFTFKEVTCMLCTAVQKDHEIFWQISWRISGSSPPNSQKMLGFGFLNLKFLSIHTHKCTHSHKLEFIYTWKECVIKKIQSNQNYLLCSTLKAVIHATWYYLKCGKM